MVGNKEKRTVKMASFFARILCEMDRLEGSFAQGDDVRLMRSYR